MFFNIMTPCSRPNNLPALYGSIETFKDSVVWYIIHDKVNKFKYFDDTPWIKEYSYHSDTSVAGHGQRNYALDIIENGFWYSLDDDNILHPWLIPAIYEYYPRFEQFGAFTFMQQLDTIHVRAGDDIRETHIDQAQLLVDRKLIGNLRFNYGNYCADGEFIEKLYNSCKDNFMYIPQVLAYYNRLKW